MGDWGRGGGSQFHEPKKVREVKREPTVYD